MVSGCIPVFEDKEHFTQTGEWNLCDAPHPVSYVAALENKAGLPCVAAQTRGDACCFHLEPLYQNFFKV